MLLEVGRIHKAHGLRGDVIVSLVTNRSERLDPGTTLDSDRGPLLVLRSTPHHDRWIVTFEGIADRTAAESYRGVVLRAEPIVDPAELWVHEIIGATLVDQHGVAHGEVVAVRDNPASDLMELADGQLVPLVFLVDLVPGERVSVDVPTGLLTDPGAASDSDEPSDA